MHKTYYFCPPLKASGHSYSSAFVLDRFWLYQHTAVLHSLKQMTKNAPVPIASITFRVKPGWQQKLYPCENPCRFIGCEKSFSARWLLPLNTKLAMD